MSRRDYDPFAPHDEGDVEVKAEEPQVEQVPAGTAKEILQWVGDDKDRAAQALEIETAEEKPRKTLVADLKKVVEDGSED